MKITIGDRLAFNRLYPQKGNMVEQILVEDIIEKVGLGQKEVKRIELKAQTNPRGGVSYNWDAEKAKDLKVDFTQAELELLKNQVKELDKAKQITQTILSICKKIREEKS